MTAASAPIERFSDNHLFRHRCLCLIQVQTTIFQFADNRAKSHDVLDLNLMKANEVFDYLVFVFSNDIFDNQLACNRGKACQVFPLHGP